MNAVKFYSLKKSMFTISHHSWYTLKVSNCRFDDNLELNLLI